MFFDLAARRTLRVARAPGGGKGALAQSGPHRNLNAAAQPGSTGCLFQAPPFLTYAKRPSASEKTADRGAIAVCFSVASTTSEPHPLGIHLVERRLQDHGPRIDDGDERLPGKI
jgi:hypothetical protein